MDYPINVAAVLVLALFVYPSQLRAADNDGETETETVTPSLELLEFLGSFETDSGIWMDPVDLMQPEFETIFKTLPEKTADNEGQEAAEPDKSDNGDGIDGN